MNEIKRYNSIVYLQILSVLLIMYSHLVVLRGFAYEPKGGLLIKDILTNVFISPLNLSGGGAFLGVSIFYMISGYFFSIKINNSERIEVKRFIFSKMKKFSQLYFAQFLAFVFFAITIFSLNSFNITTYWDQFSIYDWTASAFMYGFFCSIGNKICDVTWFLIPLFIFYFFECVYVIVRKKVTSNIVFLYVTVIFIYSLIGLVIYLNKDNSYAIMKISTYYPFVVVPFLGYLCNEIQCRKSVNVLFLLFLSYIILFLSFKLFQPQYLELNTSYMLSIFIAFFLLFFLTSLEFIFTKKSKILNLFSKLLLPLYLLHFPFGSLILSFTENNMNYNIALLFSLFIILGISVIYVYIYNTSLRFFSMLNFKCKG